MSQLESALEDSTGLLQEREAEIEALESYKAEMEETADARLKASQRDMAALEDHIERERERERT